MNGEATKTPAHIATDMLTQNGSVNDPNDSDGSPSGGLPLATKRGVLGRPRVEHRLPQPVG